MTGVEPAEKVATATGIFQSNFVGLSAGRLALASLIGSAPLPPAVAELRCLCVGREAAPAGPRDPLFQTDRSGFTWGSLRVDMATRGGFCTLVHLHVALRFWSQPHSTPSPSPAPRARLSELRVTCKRSIREGKPSSSSALQLVVSPLRMAALKTKPAPTLPGGRRGRLLCK